jgi:predicted short-subunit dehydrogenase-like oxidoreductase (DUF2520 family)
VTATGGGVSGPSRLRIIGAGRAGGALALALADAGWDVAPLLGRHDDPSAAARDVDLVVVATPDAAVRDVVRTIEPVATTVVAHLAGSLGLAALTPHPRRAAIHPLVALPAPELGAQRLRGAWFAVAGDAIARAVVGALRGRWFEVDDADRARYHAAAVVASNHVVALLGQVERLGEGVGAPFDAYLDLARATVENVAALGPARALTGPAARGDEATIRRHLRALPADERPAYRALAQAARRLAGEARTGQDHEA